MNVHDFNQKRGRRTSERLLLQHVERPSSQRDQRGFTLIEIMVALAVLSISLVVLLGLRNRGITLASRGRHIIEATILARRKITEITVAGFADLGEKEGDFGEEALEYQWRQTVVQTPFEAVRELLVQVVWKNNKQEQTVDVTTYLFDSGSKTNPISVGN